MIGFDNSKATGWGAVRLQGYGVMMVGFFTLVLGFVITRLDLVLANGRTHFILREDRPPLLTAFSVLVAHVGRVIWAGLEVRLHHQNDVPQIKARGVVGVPIVAKDNGRTEVRRGGPVRRDCGNRCREVIDIKIV
jgi:hypothetical protein